MNARLRTCFLSFCLLYVLLVTSGCYGFYYRPNAVHAPLLGYKHDYDINLNTRLSEGGDFNLQTAYAPIDHFEVVMNGMTSTSRYDNSYVKKHRFLEAGAGVFHAIGNVEINKPLRLELTGGYGIGMGSKVDGSYNAIGRYHRKYLQPAIGLKFQYFDMSYGMRLAEINFSSYSVHDQGALLEKGIFDFTTLEPNFRIAAGFRHVKFGVQISSTRALRNKEEYSAATGYNYYSATANADMFLSFNPWKEKTYELGFYNLDLMDSTHLNAIELFVHDNPCWICTPKNAPYANDIIFKVNGVETDYVHKTRDLKCHRLQISRKGYNQLKIEARNPEQLLNEPIHLTLKDGSTRKEFFVDLKDGKPAMLYLRY
jgi:hypothetical protein